MIDMRYKPYHLPQISAPYTIVLQKLDDEGVDYDMIEVNPEELNPSQGVVFSDEVGKAELDDMNPIWISNDNNVIDGHHRMVRALLDKKPLKAVKIDLNNKDSCRVLNKIQDIYEYEQSQKMEEVEAQGAINFYQGDENQFLKKLEEDNIAVQQEESSKNPVSLIGYRKDPIKENSANGNFFVANPIDGFDKYQIDFDNLFDAHETGVAYKDGQNPVDIISKLWFPHINFEALSQEYNMSSDNLKHMAIAEKAKKMGYDGIKFETIIWGLK